MAQHKHQFPVWTNGQAGRGGLGNRLSLAICAVVSISSIVFLERIRAESMVCVGFVLEAACYIDGAGKRARPIDLKQPILDKLEKGLIYSETGGEVLENRLKLDDHTSLIFTVHSKLL